MPEYKADFDEDDDAELELEPVDPAIIAHERARTQQKVDAVVQRVDVDEVYRDTSPHTDFEIDFSSWRQFRFTTRQLLILTAVLAVALTVRNLLDPCNTIFWAGIAGLAAGYYWVSRQERLREAERLRRHAEFFAAEGKSKSVEEAGSDEQPTAPPPPFKRFDVKFSFSLRQVFITMTVAAVVMGLLTLMEPRSLSLLLGAIAILGIIASIAGFEAPPILVLGWFLLLVIYLIVGVVAMFTTGDDSAARSVPTTMRLAAGCDARSPFIGSNVRVVNRTANESHRLRRWTALS